MALDWIFRSAEKSQKIWSTDYESFDQLKKHNFDQVNFGQTTPCLWVDHACHCGSTKPIEWALKNQQYSIIICIRIIWKLEIELSMVAPFRAFLLNSRRSHKNWPSWMCSGHFKCFGYFFINKYFFVLKIIRFLSVEAVLLSF